MNGYRLDLTNDEAYELVMDVAKGLADAPDIAPRLNLVERARR
jgi:prophage maintenance system killer protein